MSEQTPLETLGNFKDSSKGCPRSSRGNILNEISIDFIFFAAPDVHPATFAVTFFSIERVTDNAFKLIQFVCIGIRMDSGIMRERADAAANGEVFPKLLTRKTFSLKRCDLFFEPRRFFFVDFQSAFNAIC